MTVFNEYLNGLLRFTIWGHYYSSEKSKGLYNHDFRSYIMIHVRLKTIIINNLGLINLIVRAIYLIATLRDHEFDC